MLRFVLQLCAYVVGIPLEVLIIAALLRGSYKRFPALFAYMVAFFLTTAVEVPLYVIGALQRLQGNYEGWREYVFLYWIDEIVLMLLVFLVILGFIYNATATLRSRRMVRTIVTGGSLVFAAATFWAHYDSKISSGLWMTGWASNLNFCAAILDLGLWSLLIGLRRKDHCLLMLSGGLGLQFTGNAIGESIRNIATGSHSSALTFAGGMVIIVTNLSFLYVWRQALRERSSDAPHATAAASAEG